MYLREEYLIVIRLKEGSLPKLFIGKYGKNAE